MDLISIIFPKRCINCRAFGAYICANCFALLDFELQALCAVCGRQAVSGVTHPICRGRYTIDGVSASLVYKGVCKKLIYQFKFQPYVTDLKRLMGDLFYEGLIQQEEFTKLLLGEAILVPIPLAISKERLRGYNQSAILAAELGRRLKLPVVDALMRQHSTASQVGKTQLQRRENIKGAFMIKRSVEKRLSDKTVLLVDDIVTSGATMSEAASVLKRSGADKVWGLAFAHGV